MFIDFEDLPKAEMEYLIERFGLPDTEEKLVRLKYVHGFSYLRIANELHLSEKSIGPMLTRARKHMIAIAKTLHELHDERVTKLIAALGWDVLEWPTKANRRKYLNSN